MNESEHREGDTLVAAPADSASAEATNSRPGPMIYILVPLMLVAAGSLMACAWIAHLKFKHWAFLTSLVMSWLFVLPEYILNVYSSRWGREVFSAAQMASIHLASGVIAVALVSRYFLQEPLSVSQLVGFGLMLVSISLIVFKP